MHTKYDGGYLSNLIGTVKRGLVGETTSSPGCPHCGEHVPNPEHDADRVEPRVRGLLQALAEHGCTVFASCGGHCGPDGLSPMVSFRTSPERASHIGRIVWHAQLDLHHAWHLSAHFMAKFDFAPAYRLSVDYRPSSLDCHALDEDMAVLARALTPVGQQSDSGGGQGEQQDGAALSPEVAR